MPDPDDDVEIGGNIDQLDRGSQVPGTRIVRSKSVTVLPRTEVIEDVLDTNLNAYMGIDFGIVYPLSLGNLVWEDVNNNGVVDSGEPGAAGVVSISIWITTAMVSFPMMSCWHRCFRPPPMTGILYL